MKTFLVLWLSLIIGKYAALNFFFSSMPGSPVTVTYDRGSMLLAAGLAGMLVFLTVRAQSLKSKTRLEQVQTQPDAQPLAA